VSSWNGSVG